MKGGIKLAGWPNFKEHDFPTFSKDGIAVKFSFDNTSAYSPPSFSNEELARISNPPINQVFVNLETKGISAELAEYIMTTKKNWEPPELAKEYRDLADTIFDTTMYYLNRLVVFFRTEKGQYWLEEFVDSAQKELNSLGETTHPKRVLAEARFDDSDWFRWDPMSHPGVLIFSFGDPRAVTVEDWSRAWDFVGSGRNTDLPLELLVQAETLGENKHDRSALTEAITALEVALSRFAENPASDLFLNDQLRARFGTTRLKNLREHLGLTGTVHYLLPIIFSEAELDSKTLSDCRQAIEQRNNVVHKGQRKVKDLNKMLAAVRKMVLLLVTRTGDPGPDSVE
ncbi:hypothetical protein KF728_21360 [Candidatus Obscuribacterales bacterium]|nr:hypothetical protein [Candidatus Obscuribacterales bacterium]